MTKPRIAILMPAYNAEKTIIRTIDSLKRNDEPHDIVIVDDCSALPLEEVLPRMPNVKILRMKKNGGIVKALNYGLSYILEHGYDYIARMDADDLSTPNRLVTQRVFLDEHADIAIVGSWGRIVSEIGETLFYLRCPETHEQIVHKLYYNSPFLHPSVMMRASIFQTNGGYSDDYPSAEDYELFYRLSRCVKMANIPSYLIDYTMSASGISLSRRCQQLTSRLKIQWLYRRWISGDFYLGLCKTVLLFSLSTETITAIKRRKKEYSEW